MTNDHGLPASVDAERTVLGAICLDNDAFHEAAEKLQAEDFSLDSHRRIFLRMSELIRAGRTVDIVTLSEILAKNKEVQAVGGVAYLASLTEGLPHRPVIDEYIRIVKDKSLLRRVIVTCQSALERAHDQSESATEILTTLGGDLESIANSSEESSDLESVGQWLSRNDVFAERVPGIMTGIEDYDELTYGFHPGELTVVAGRPGAGKTSCACTFTWQIARKGKSVAMFLNEQRKQSFIGRMLCGRSSVSFKHYRRGELDYVERGYIQEAMAEFKTLPIFWDQKTPMTIASIRAKSKRLLRSGELDIVLIDQLTGISNEGYWEKGKRSDEIIGAKVKALKHLAMELDVPVVLYHQLNRGSTRNADSRPTLADLKGSGEIEEHADNVDFLHRPSYYDRESREPDVIIRSKSRDGETGDVKCEFVPWLCLWRGRR